MVRDEGYAVAMASAARPPPEHLRIGSFSAGELEAGIVLLARAFRDNPLNRAVLAPRGPEDRERANAHGMRAHLPAALAAGEVLAARHAGRLAGLLVAAPPYVYPFPPPPLAARLRCLLGQGFRVVRRWAAIQAALQERHPLEPSWYLGTLGVAPPLQGRGIGTALLARWLSEVDRDGAPACLETDLALNLPFYERAGFAVVGELTLFGVTVWRMRRAAGGPGRVPRAPG